MAVTEKVAVSPAVTVWLAGWVVIVGGPCAGAKVAQTKVVPVIVSVQGPVPAQPAAPITLQPVNVDPALGVAVSVTGVLNV